VADHAFKKQEPGENNKGEEEKKDEKKKKKKKDKKKKEKSSGKLSLEGSVASSLSNHTEF
jgi:hypothetical protein